MPKNNPKLPKHAVPTIPAPEGVRIDAAHAFDMGSPAAPPALAAAAKIESGEVELATAQANQLIQHLRDRQSDIDRRETNVNARIAEVEHDTRAARLWLNEREAEIVERLADLDRREASLLEQTARMENEERLSRRRAAEVAAAEEDLRARTHQLDEMIAAHKEARKTLATDRQRLEEDHARGRQLLAAEQAAAAETARKLMEAVERKRAALEAEEQRLQERRATVGGRLPADWNQRRSALADRAALLEQAEARLAADQADAQRLAEQLAQQQRQLDQRARDERRQLAEEHRAAMTALDEQRRNVERRAEQVDRSRAGLKQLREELGRLQRETLEIRLATEELWAQLAGAAPPATLTRSLGQVRSKLAENYRVESEQLRQQHLELESLREELASGHEKLARQKRQFDAWAESRSQQIDEMARRLVLREQELHQQEDELTRQRQGWRMERLELQQTIRRLEAQAETAVV